MVQRTSLLKTAKYLKFNASFVCKLLTIGLNLVATIALSFICRRLVDIGSLGSAPYRPCIILLRESIIGGNGCSYQFS